MSTALASWELPDTLWQAMEPLLPVLNARRGRPRSVDLKRIAAGIFFVLRTGIQWHALPREPFGPASTVYYYFRQWDEAGVFEAVWATALAVYDGEVGLAWTWQSIDGGMTKAPLGGETTGPNPTDRSKSGTKRSVHTDGGGPPIGSMVAGANRPDMKLLRETLEATVVPRPTPTEQAPQGLSLDKGYDYPECRHVVEEFGYTPHIRSRGEERHAKETNPGYKARRWVVERALSWINRFRKVLIRFEKLTRTHYALLCFACAYIALKRADLI